MSEPIKVGDLVMKVRACCDRQLDHWCKAGVPWVVEGFSDAGKCYCQYCGATFLSVTYVLPKQVWVNWLKKIPPLSELQGEKRDEELTA